MAEILYDDKGEPVTVAIPGNAPDAPTAVRGFLGVAVDDGGVSRLVVCDSAGRQLAVGAAASGSPVAGNPVLIGGSDGTNARTLRTATDGTIRVDPTGTTQQPVSQGTKGAGSNAWPTVLYDSAGNAVQVTNDAGTRRLNIIGKVQVTGASPPPATTPANIFADTPLTVGTDDTTFVIPDGETFFLQEVVAGNEDPTKGASIEVLYDDGTERLVARLYIAGTTLSIGFPDRSEARDGTTMVGNAGGTNTIIVRRAKFSGSDIAIDAVVRGYTV